MFDPAAFTHELADLCFVDAVPVAVMRDALVEHARQLVSRVGDGGDSGSPMALADGDSFTYRNAYRNAAQW